jgi:beta-lactamase regulating signal transducer with metallopeptidase domain
VLSFNEYRNPRPSRVHNEAENRVMNWIWSTPEGWLFRSVVGGGVLLLLTWLLMSKTRQPARRQRLGEWGLGVAMLFAILNLGPVWIPVFAKTTPASPDTPNDDKPQPPSPPLTFQNPRNERGASFAFVPSEELPHANPNELNGLMDVSVDAGLDVGTTSLKSSTQLLNDNGDNSIRSEQSASASSSAGSRGLLDFVRFFSIDLVIPAICIIYASVAAFLIGRWLLGYLALQRLLSSAGPAPAPVRRTFAEMTGPGRRPRLLVSSRLRVPLSCGTLRPTIVLPACLLRGLMPPAQEARLRWVFAHELTHLRRRDAWSCLLFGLGQGLYFLWPWFWRLRRQVRLCQEYVADAVVVRTVGAAEDYAEFLLSMTTAPAVPVSATGVMGNSSDLFRRVTMLLKTPKRMERTGSWRWTWATAGGLLALAIVVSGIGPKAAAKADNVKKGQAPADKTAPDDEKKDAPKTPQPGAPGFAPFGGAFQFDDNNDQGPQQMMRRMQGMMGARFGNHGRLGVRISPPNETLADQLDLPKGQGLVIDQVVAESPAAKGGIKNNDILLEFNGKPVPNNVQEFVRSVHEIKADAKVDAVVLRKGKKETIKGLTLPEEKQVGFGGQGGFPQFGQPGQGGFGGGGFGGQGGFPQFGQPGQGGFGGGFGGGVGKGIPAPEGGFGNNRTVMTTVTRTDDRFTTRHQEGSLIITVTGTVADGKSKTNKIHVQDGRESHDFESVDKVPDQYKDKVKNLVDMSEKGSVRIEIKTPDAKPEAKPEAK